MRKAGFGVLALTSLIVVGTPALHASDRVAVYARVDRVVLAPDANAPRTIQVFGVFSVAKPNNPNDYEAPAHGYLYFALVGDETQTRREWNDLKQIAGTHQIVALGNRYTTKPRVRAEKDAPSDPDPYGTDTGLTKVNGRTDYAPIRGLIDSRN